MEISETVLVRSREEWRAWLEANHDTKSEIWLVYPKAHTGQPRVPYAATVEEALCFGWIDSTQKRIDEDYAAQRFTPRRPGSAFSQTNKERLARMIAAGKALPEVAKGAEDLRPELFKIPADVIAALKAEPGAWEFFSATAPPYQRIRATYVDDAREVPELFAKRLENLVRMSAKRKLFGYGIEEFYIDPASEGTS